jgi:hypothetical protein
MGAEVLPYDHSAGGAADHGHYGQDEPARRV